jgi:molybdopterin/thiamine biosynthesis adenylyltransferase
MGPVDPQLTPFADPPAPAVWPPQPSWRRWGASPPGDPCPARLKGLPGDPLALAQACVIIEGLGAVGGLVLAQLARIGVGTLIGVDPDRYESDSWLTQPCEPTAAGQPKAGVQGATAHRINPRVRVCTALGCAQDVPLSIRRRAQVVVVAGDNLELVVAAGVTAGALGQVLIQGAVHGETATAIVRSYANRATTAPCPACHLTAGEWAGLKSRFGCDPKTLAKQGAHPTRTLPTICAIAAQLVSHEVLKWLLGASSQALRDAELNYSLVAHRLWRSALPPRNLNCRTPHRSWPVADVEDAPDAVTLGDLVARLDARAFAANPAAFQVQAEVPWIDAVHCARCGAVRSAARFARLGETVGRCPCGAGLTADHTALSTVIPADRLAGCLRMTLASLGLGPGDSLSISLGDDGRYFFLAGGPLADFLFGPGDGEATFCP